MDLGFNNRNNNGDLLNSIIKVIPKLSIILTSFQGCLVVFISIIAILTPMMLMDGVISAVEETVDEIADTTSDIAERALNFFTFHGWNTNEESFHKELKDEYESYKEDGIILDTRLIMSIVFYDEPADDTEDYSCEVEESSSDSEEEEIKKFRSCVSGKEDDYAQYRDEVHELIGGMVENGSLKSEEDFNAWLKENFIEDKLKSLNYTIPDDETQKDKLFNEFIDNVYTKKTLYEELLDEDSGQCTYTQNPDSGSRQKVRTTVYSSHDDGYSLGGTLGDIRNYFKKGYVYLNDEGYYMWKGGNKSSKGKVYGETGTDYLIVAVSTKAKDVIGKNVTVGKCKVRVNELDDIPYFSYGDTFTMQLTTDKGKTYKTYNSIALDTCGACMVYSPSYPCISKMEGSKLKETNNTKIDVYVDKTSSQYKHPADYGYYMSGNSSGVCMGTIDLGALVPGNKGTKTLNKPIKEIIGEAGIQELNNQIKANVEKYGKGTGNAAAAAAITLINGLKQKGYHLPYLYGGGHNSGEPANGIDLKWGRNDYQTDEKGRSLYSYDCSGFVSWALYQAGCPKTSSTTSSMISGKPVKRIKNIKDAKPGDIVNDPGSHVVMVVQNNGGDITFAESTTKGIIFTKPGSGFEGSRDISGYDIWDMSEYYKQYCQH